MALPAAQGLPADQFFPPAIARGPIFSARHRPRTNFCRPPSPADQFLPPAIARSETPITPLLDIGKTFRFGATTRLSQLKPPSRIRLKRIPTRKVGNSEFQHLASNSNLVSAESFMSPKYFQFQLFQLYSNFI